MMARVTEVLSCIAIAMFAAGLYWLDFVGSGFALSTIPGVPRYEVLDKVKSSRLFSTAFVAPKEMTWGDIADLFSLSGPLLQESYHCTFKVSGTTVGSESEIRAERIQSQDSVQVVLRLGACPALHSEDAATPGTYQ
jgi:hypothetical protein